MKLIALMAVKDEAHRYLESAICWLKPQVNHVFVADDRSADQSAQICLDTGTDVYTRMGTSPSFLEAEGTFRQTAWERMADVYGLTENDWVLGIDADEFAVEADIRAICQQATKQGYGSVDVQIPEIFCLNPLARRVDGYWGSIQGTRLARYKPGSQQFRTSRMGCGMFPEYAYQCRNWKNSRLKILHYGYATEEDRKSKYTRYTSLNQNGHADSHIQSILKVPQLVLWEGETPDMWRGKR